MTWRKLSALEAALIEKLLASSFPGRDEIGEQVRNALVRRLDEDGSLEFRPGPGVPAPVRKRIPAEAQAKDRDGTWIHALLHVVGGRVKELEFYREDSAPILEMPSAEHWELVELD